MMLSTRTAAGTIMVALLAGCNTGGHRSGPALQAIAADPVLIEARQAALETLPSGASRQWDSPATGTRGSIAVVKTYREPGGRWCREAKESLVVSNGNATETRALYCRAKDGGWSQVAAG